MSTFSHARRARVAAVVLLPGLAALAACGDSTGDDRSQSAGEAGTSATQEPTAGATASPSAEASPTDAPSEAGDPVALPLYYVGDTPQGARLFREFLSVAAADPLLEAARLVTSGSSIQDPDYRTLFPAGSGSVTSVRATDGVFVVEVADASWAERPEGMTAAQAKLAVQQLVHTLQAVHQARAPMTVLLGGEPTTLLGVDTSEGVTNADPLDVLAMVNVTVPEQGSTVSGSFRAQGVASVFEANVPWEILRDGQAVKSGFSTAEGWMDKLYPWQSDEIDVSDLEPGTYTFVASTGDPSGGEGPGPTTDSKDFTVE